MRVSAAIKSLIHGVTTDNLVNADSRYMAEQVNTITRIDEGLTKRPPTELITNMGTPLPGNDAYFVKDFLIHDVAYFLVVRSGAMVIYREDGVEFTVVDATTDSYLSSLADEKDVDITVHGEQVFIVNRNRVVAMTTNTDTNVYNSLIIVKSAVPASSAVTVNISDSNGIRRTTSFNVGTTTAATAVDVVAAQLATAINALAGISATSAGAVVETLRTDNNYAEITIDSSFGNEVYFTIMNGKVNDFEDLPRFAYHGHVTEVKKEGQAEFEPVYMKAVGESYLEQLSSAPGAPAPWPTATWGTITGFWWSDNAGTKNPSSNAPTATYKYLSFYPGPGALIHSGNEVYRIDIAVYTSATDAIRSTLTVQFLTNPAPSVAEFRMADATTPNTTFYNTAVSVLGPAWYADTDVSQSGANDALLRSPPAGGFGLWIDVYEAPAIAMSGLIGVRWVESTEQGLPKNINSETMPHILTVTGETEFTYNTVAWDDRQAGNEASNPLPKFIGKTIEDIIVFQNRLCMLTGDEFIASTSGNVFSFFRDTVTQLLSKHPVNLRSTASNSSKLRHFVFHNRDLLISAARQQYKISGDIALVPQGASMQLTTSYNSSETVSPISIGNSVYLPNKHGNYLNVNKYDGSVQSLQPDAADNITQHARKYIDGNVNSLAGLPNHGLLFANYSRGSNIFVCNYDTMIDRQQDKRFAWFKWNDFVGTDFTVQAIATVKNTLLVAINSASGLDLLSMDMDAETNKVYLDHQVTGTAGTFLEVGPDYAIAEADIVVVQGEGCPSPGDECTDVTYSGNFISWTENCLGGTVYVGKEFNAQVVPNLVTVRDEGGQVNNAANLRINGFDIRVRDTGEMTATERGPYDTYETQEFTGLVSGSLDAITDQEATTTAEFQVGFKQKADKGTLLLESKSWLPMTITQIDWKGNYTSRGRRF